MYPRALTPFETRAIEAVLPRDTPGYRTYLEFARARQVIGEGRWGAGDLILAQQPESIDLKAGMTPVIAFGEIDVVLQNAHHQITITVNEPLDDQIEVQFSSDLDLAVLAEASIASISTPSTWKPTGRTMQSPVYEVPIRNRHETEYVLAADTTRSMLWLHHTRSGFNQFIPVTGFYEYLLRSHPQKEKKAALNAKLFFAMLPELNEQTMRKTLLHYNAENRKFDASRIEEERAPERSWLDRLKQRFSRAT